MALRRWILVALLAAALGCAGCVAAPPAVPAAPALPTTVQGAGGTTVVSLPSATQPCCPHATICDFLGFNQLCQVLGKLGTRILSRLGSRFPGLEPKPELLTITDPKNLDSANPGVQTAAEVKAEEDAAPQKIKAIRYLATIGCAGCYPDVQDALLAALDDCTESVRYEAAMALRSTSGCPCATCKTKACCSPKVIEKLTKIANDMDDHGCYKESSARVRRMARLAIAGCGSVTIPPKPEGPQEGPSEEAPPAEAAATLSALDRGTFAAHSGVRRPAVTLLSGFSPLTSALGLDKPEAATTPPIGTAADPSIDTGTARALPANITSSLPAGHGASTHVPCLAGAQDQPSGTILARVNGQPIYDRDVAPRVDRELAQMDPVMPVRLRQDFRQTLLEQEVQRLIDRTLLCQEARRAAPGTWPALADPDTVAAAWLAGRLSVDADVSAAELTAWHEQHGDPDEPPGEASLAGGSDEVRRQVLRERRLRQERVYLDTLRRAADVWTTFDAPAPTVQIVPAPASPRAAGCQSCGNATR